MAKSRTAEIKKLIDENKAVIGTDRSISMLKLGEISRVYLSSNVPDKVKA